MRLQLLKSILIYTLSLLTTGSCLPQGLWQNKNSPVVIIRRPLNIELGLKSSLEIPKRMIARFLGTERDINYVEQYANGLDKNWINHNNIDNVIVKEPQKDRNYIGKNHDEDLSSTSKNYDDIDEYTKSTDVIINDARSTDITTECTETTTEFTTETFGTEDYESTTYYDGVLSRSGVSASVVASLLG